MSSRRSIALGLGVTALLAVAGIASRGRPLSSGRGRGPTAGFFDYVFTTVVLFSLLTITAFVAIAFTQRLSGGNTPRRRRWHVLSTFVSLAGGALIAALILHSGLERRLRQLEDRIGATRDRAGAVQPGRHAARHVRGARIRWDEVTVIVALLGATAVLLYTGRTVGRRPRRWPLARHEAISLSLDESLDDLRADPDLRRAIVAAYARMEQALARAGIARAPAEAPFEYLERALGSLDASSESIRRLTALFEWAKFSHHEPDPAMREEAVTALVAVRDELRSLSPVPA